MLCCVLFVSVLCIMPNVDWLSGLSILDIPFGFSVKIFSIMNTSILFQMRYTKKLSMWPVGLSGNRKFERPIVRNGKVRILYYKLQSYLFWKFMIHEFKNS